MGIDVTKAIDVGARQVLFYPETGNVVNFGATSEGVTVNVPTDVFDRLTQETGSTPFAINQTGVAGLSVTATFLQRNFENLKRYLTSALMTNSGTPVASTTIAALLAQGATTIVLTSETGFEDVPETGYVVVLDPLGAKEEVLVKYIDTATKTLGSATCPVERGYNGTDDVEHAISTDIDRVTTVIDLDPRPQELPTGKLILRPVGETNETDRDITIYKCAIVGNISPVLTVGAQAGYAITFRALLDINCEGLMRIMRIGKDSVVPAVRF